MKRIYVAGAYSADNIITMLNNIREGMRLGTQVLLAGFAPFVPWFNFHFQLMLMEGETITVQEYLDYSIEWLRVSEAVLLVPGWENSHGTCLEIREAKYCKIPIFEQLPTLIEAWRRCEL